MRGRPAPGHRGLGHPGPGPGRPGTRHPGYARSDSRHAPDGRPGSRCPARRHTRNSPAAGAPNPILGQTSGPTWDGRPRSPHRAVNRPPTGAADSGRSMPRRRRPAGHRVDTRPGAIARPRPRPSRIRLTVADRRVRGDRSDRSLCDGSLGDRRSWPARGRRLRAEPTGSPAVAHPTRPAVAHPMRRAAAGCLRLVCPATGPSRPVVCQSRLLALPAISCLAGRRHHPARFRCARFRCAQRRARAHRHLECAPARRLLSPGFPATGRTRRPGRLAAPQSRARRHCRARCRRPTAPARSGCQPYLPRLISTNHTSGQASGPVTRHQQSIRAGYARLRGLRAVPVSSHTPGRSLLADTKNAG